jgi:hypothetical protein
MPSDSFASDSGTISRSISTRLDARTNSWSGSGFGKWGQKTFSMCTWEDVRNSAIAKPLISGRYPRTRTRSEQQSVPRTLEACLAPKASMELIKPQHAPAGEPFPRQCESQRAPARLGCGRRSALATTRADVPSPLNDHTQRSACCDEPGYAKISSKKVCIAFHDRSSAFLLYSIPGLPTRPASGFVKLCLTPP